MENKDNPEGFIPIHGGYRHLINYQKSEIIYDGTVYFTVRYFRKYDRTIDHMVQAARSGKQNIAEASMASATSKDILLPSIEEKQLIVDELESRLTVCDKIEETISQSLLQAEKLWKRILKKAFKGNLVQNHANPLII